MIDTLEPFEWIGETHGKGSRYFVPIGILERPSRRGPSRILSRTVCCLQKRVIRRHKPPGATRPEVKTDTFRLGVSNFMEQVPVWGSLVFRSKVCFEVFKQNQESRTGKGEVSGTREERVFVPPKEGRVSDTREERVLAPPRR